MSQYPAVLESQCRACLEIVSFLHPLEGVLANCDVSISTMISFCTQNKVELSDDLPSGVCVPCFRTIRIAYNFIRQFRDSQEKLLEKRAKSKHNTSESETEIETSENDFRPVCLENKEDSQSGEMEECQSDPKFDFTDNQSADEEEYMDFLGTEDFEVGQDDILLNDKDETEREMNETEYDTNDSDLLVDQLESGVYELENNACQRNLQVRIFRQDAPANTHENTVFKMKLNTRYHCPICPNMIYRHFEQGLMQHMASHTDQTFACNSCLPSDTEYDVDTFLKHFADIHLHQCHFCAKSFKNRSTLLKHVKSHTNMLHSCKFKGCGKEYPSRSALNKHETTHADSIKHVCSECGLNFKTYDTYRYHMKRHEGNKFLCSICGRTFILSVNLKYHMLAHRGGRPFKCSFCDKTYTSYTPLNKHMRRHHADKKRNNSRYYQYD